ncbi:MAG TPA: carboxymuconolactone decarboxylase family protein [Acetobacteraceae bacterium]|nr:carboxymuconolactone decarboxylase family protein [Acetobacteraceae bacterium]
MAELDERAERGLAIFARMMGPVAHDAMREGALSGKFASAISRLAVDYAFGDVWSRDGLAMRERSLVTLGVLIAQRQVPEIKNHVKIGVRNGLTMREIEEVLVQATPYVGFPCIATATTAVIEALREIDMDPHVQTSEERGLL